MHNTYLTYWVVVLAIGEFQFGYAMGELSLLTKALDALYGHGPYTGDKPFWANTMVPIGATLGSLLAGVISYYGRRTCIYVANGFVIIG